MENIFYFKKLMKIKLVIDHKILILDVLLIQKVIELNLLKIFLKIDLFVEVIMDLNYIL
jgi:hypothetical protein